LTHPHNELLFWAVEGGIIALIALLAAAYLVWQRIYKCEIWTRLALIGIFFPIVLHSQLEFPFYQSTAHIIVFVLLVYWVDNMTAEYKVKELSSTLVFGVTGIIIPVVTTIFITTSLYSGLLLAKFEAGKLDNIEELEKINNPVIWQDRLAWAMRSRLVINGISSNQPELVRGYIEWIPELISREPRPIFYKYLIIAYQVLGQGERVREIQQQAYYLFPDDQFEIADISRIIARPVSLYSNPDSDQNGNRL